MREAMRMLTGACVVYAVMAACSGADSGPRAQLGGAGLGATGAGGLGTGAGGEATTLADASGMLEQTVDSMVSPVKEAAAQVAPPQVDDVPCDKSFPYPPGAATKLVFAEKSYPGKTATELGHIIVMGKMAGPLLPSAPPGYEWQVTLAHLRDGAAAVVCGSEAGPSYSTIRFIL